MIWVWWLVIAAILMGLICLGVSILAFHKEQEVVSVISCGATGAMFIIAVISSIVSGCFEFNRVHDPIYWQEFSTMCQDVIDSGNTITNRDMTNQVIEYNTWLVNARSNQQVFGTWSIYHDIDLSGFTYINLGDGTEFDINFGN